MIKSLLRNQDALKLFFVNLESMPRSEVPSTILALRPKLTDTFWQRAILLWRLLKDIDKELRESEGDNQTIFTSVLRWERVWRSLESLSQTNTHILPIPVLLNLFEARIRRQLTDNQWLAFRLHPDAVGRPVKLGRFYEVDIHRAVHRCLVQHGLDPVEAGRELYRLHSCQDQFMLSNDTLWAYKTDPQQFWGIAKYFAPKIGVLACRFNQTLCSSVPSERGFSAMKLIHSQMRNRLAEDRVDKLIYIHMNQRVLRRKPKKKRDLTKTSLGGPQREEWDIEDDEDDEIEARMLAEFALKALSEVVVEVSEESG
jgi:hypothetical protein